MENGSETFRNLDAIDYKLVYMHIQVVRSCKIASEEYIMGINKASSTLCINVSPNFWIKQSKYDLSKQDNDTLQLCKKMFQKYKESALYNTSFEKNLMVV